VTAAAVACFEEDRTAKKKKTLLTKNQVPVPA
jgi:hypothetical protein